MENPFRSVDTKSVVVDNVESWEINREHIRCSQREIV